MARKTKAEAQETYEALLDAAERVFSEKGVTNTTLNDVAGAAGMTRGAIYWHFKDKYDLLYALCDRTFLPMETLLNEISECQQLDPKVALKHSNMQFLQLVTGDQHQRNVCNIILHRCERTPEIKVFEKERTQKNECLGKIQSILDRAVSLGRLPADTDTWVAMQANHAFLIGLVHQWIDDPESYDLPLHAEGVVDMFLSGLFSNPPRRLNRPAAGSATEAAASDRQLPVKSDSQCTQSKGHDNPGQ